MYNPGEIRGLLLLKLLPQDLIKHFHERNVITRAGLPYGTVPVALRSDDKTFFDLHL